ncbi:hypothetical protein AL755_08575 [Arthrobacter sp. ERGS1:01]|uniref:hypothetical protein n=1 Tax=Arthrobacter sp. ERGS1:01 TaxID=1704044 RepID=UPI0006B5EB31|nr:hypothetical protein [Arthrobacter sp. ERGS1:01]ALE05522.1 hypothetical protein AL755_08575 [Arthrobacter sp. ERGS1:01]
MTFRHNGNTYDEADLLPLGDRVNPEAIAAGLMKEITVKFNGQERHLPLISEAGITKLKEEFDRNDASEWTRPTPESDETSGMYIILDDNGMPTATMDIDQIQTDAMGLVFSLAAHCGDEAKTEEILAEQVTLHTTHGLSLVFIAALKSMTNDILAGAFDVMEATTGAKPREKMAELGGTPFQDLSA